MKVFFSTDRGATYLAERPEEVPSEDLLRYVIEGARTEGAWVEGRFYYGCGGRDDPVIDDWVAYVRASSIDSVWERE